VLVACSKNDVRLLLANRLQMVLWWGPKFCQLYNDAFWPALGTKHPRSMGQPASECWAVIWQIIGPLALRGSDRLRAVMPGTGFEPAIFFRKTRS
jgi:hypothetical protein